MISLHRGAVLTGLDHCSTQKNIQHFRCHRFVSKQISSSKSQTCPLSLSNGKKAVEAAQLFLAGQSVMLVRRIAAAPPATGRPAGCCHQAEEYGHATRM
jgi:hypothetical protein